MNLITRKPETNEIQYHNYVGEIMFSDIFEQVHNVKELEVVMLNLCTSMEIAANDWYSDNVTLYVDPFCVNYDCSLEEEE